MNLAAWADWIRWSVFDFIISDIAKLHRSLLSFSNRSVSEMYDEQKYQAALDFADRYGLDRDEVLKSQWLHSAPEVNEINMFLSVIKDQVFVLSECMDRVGPTEEAVRALISHGLHLTYEYKFSTAEINDNRQIWDFRLARLKLLQLRDKLETFIGINMGRFSAQEYNKFRHMHLNEVAVTLAESGKIGALNILFKRHSLSLMPFMLEILAAIPETVPVQSYGQLLPGNSPPSNIALRENDWVECQEMVTFISKLPENHESSIHLRTEPIMKLFLGFSWPSTNELSVWYKSRARNMDSLSGQLDNCLSLVDLACRKGIYELKPFHQDLSYLQQLIYYDGTDDEVNLSTSLVAWEQLSDYEKFKMMLRGVKQENIVERLHEKAIPFMQNRFHITTSVSEDVMDEPSAGNNKAESFLVRWLKEIASENKLDISLKVIEEGCKDSQSRTMFEDKSEAVDCALQCIYMCTTTSRWSTMALILSKLPKLRDSEVYVEVLNERLKMAEGHIEAGRLLSLYQIPKPLYFFLESHSDGKGVKQILRLVLSKFVHRHSENDWAKLWRDLQSLREKAFPFLDQEYMLTEFCRGLMKAGKFSLARNYLRGTASVALATDKAENIVIQAAREYFFSASSLTGSEVWKARECLNLFPRSRIVKAEADMIDALTVKLPNLGVNILPVQFRQIKDPMDIVKLAITSQVGVYLNVDEIVEVAKLVGLSSQDDISAVQEAIAREAAVAGDLQLAFDLCLVLAKTGHGSIWDLCAAMARGHDLENIDLTSRKQLLGFALSHCDEESIGELLHAWKDLDMEVQCEKLMILSGTEPPKFSVHDSSIISSVQNSKDMVDPMHLSEQADGVKCEDQELHIRDIRHILANYGVPIQSDISNRLTTTLVALKSSQLVLAISPSIEISTQDLSTADSAVACFIGLCGEATFEPHIDALLAILGEWECLFRVKGDEADSANGWGIDVWDEGWESFREETGIKESKQEDSFFVHPLHLCWLEILKKLVTLSRFRDLLKLIDQSVVKFNGVLLDRVGAHSLAQIVLGMDCFVALKLALSFPYEEIQLQCLDAVEHKLKQGGGAIAKDHEILVLVLSSGIVSTIMSGLSKYGTTFSFLCYMIGSFSRQYQETQLSKLKQKVRTQLKDNNDDVDLLFLFGRFLFPCFVSELVKADQQILAGFLVTKFMHNNASLSLINVADASLKMFFERQLQIHVDECTNQDVQFGEPLGNTISQLIGQLGNLIKSALSVTYH